MRDRVPPVIPHLSERSTQHQTQQPIVLGAKSPLRSRVQPIQIFFVSILDASIELWKLRTSAIYGVWYDPEYNLWVALGLLVALAAAGITKETWRDARGDVVSRCWPANLPDASRPHLGGTLDTYPQHRPDLLARHAAEGRRREWSSSWMNIHERGKLRTTRREPMPN